MSDLRPRTVFELWFVKKYDEYEERPFQIGCYWSAADCRAAITRLKNKPGFRDYPEGFKYGEVQIGMDHWEEGFISWEESLAAIPSGSDVRQPKLPERWVVIFEDHDEEISKPIRERHGNAHFDYLEGYSDEILIGGGLRPQNDEWYSGGLWVVEVLNRQRAVELCEADPYFKHGLRKGYRLYRWGKAPCYGEVVL